MHKTHERATLEVHKSGAAGVRALLVVGGWWWGRGGGRGDGSGSGGGASAVYTLVDGATALLADDVAVAGAPLGEVVALEPQGAPPDPASDRCLIPATAGAKSTYARSIADFA